MGVWLQFRFHFTQVRIQVSLPVSAISFTWVFFGKQLELLEDLLVLCALFIGLLVLYFLLGQLLYKPGNLGLEGHAILAVTRLLVLLPPYILEELRNLLAPILTNNLPIVFIQCIYPDSWFSFGKVRQVL